MPLFAFFGALLARIATGLIGGISALLPFIAGYLGASAIQFLVSIGFGVVTFTGIDLIVEALLDFAVSAFSGVPQRVIQMMGYLWVDKAFNLIFSSGVTLMTLKGVRGGSVSRQMWKNPVGGSGS